MILPKIDPEKQVWQLFGEPVAISCNDEELNLSFACTFDEDHHWSIVYTNGKFGHVYLEAAVAALGFARAGGSRMSEHPDSIS